MLARHATAGFSGILITAALFWLMQFLLLQDLSAKPVSKTPTLIHLLETYVDTAVRTRPIEPPPPIDPPLQAPRTTTVAIAPLDPPSGFAVPEPTPFPAGHSGFKIDGFDTPQADNDLIPIVRPDALYPNRALERELEGFVDLRFTVTSAGFTENIQVIAASNQLFKAPAIRSVERFKYRPRVVNGQNVAVSGVETRITFKLDQ